MPKRARPPHLYEFAKRGAEVQFRELLHEAKLLMKLFPHLRDAFDNDELPLEFIMAKASGAVTKKAGRRRQLSSAARQALSARMKKHRAARRRASGKAQA